MANIFKVSEDLEAAKESYKQALKITPYDAKIHNNIGLTLCCGQLNLVTS
jgi:Tfp pilus assembly protein PilF